MLGRRKAGCEPCTSTFSDLLLNPLLKLSMWGHFKCLLTCIAPEIINQPRFQQMSFNKSALFALQSLFLAGFCSSRVNPQLLNQRNFKEDLSMLLSINGLPMVLAFSNRPITPLARFSDTPKVGTGSNGKKLIKIKIQINRHIIIIVWCKIFACNISGVNNIDTRLMKFSHICRKIVEVYKEDTRMLHTTTVISALTYNNEKGLLILQRFLSLQEAK